MQKIRIDWKCGSCGQQIDTEPIRKDERIQVRSQSPTELEWTEGATPRSFGRHLVEFKDGKLAVRTAYWSAGRLYFRSPGIIAHAKITTRK